MKPLVSVIVPVYNVKKYVEACLDSLCAQSLEKIEILVIDDGSRDGSGEVCDRFAQKDKRIRVIHQQNLGLSAARNIGIELAQAPYLMFVDSDDTVHRDFCRIPYETACREACDVVIFGHLINGKIAYDAETCGIQSGVQNKEAALRAGRRYMGNYAWNKLYKRQLFDTIRFPEGRLYEAIGTTYRILLKAEKIVYTPRHLYFYRKRKGTISTNRSRQNFLERISMMQQYADGIAAAGFEKEARDSALTLAMLAVRRLGTKNQAVQRYVNDLKRTDYIPEEWSRAQKFLLERIKRSNLQFNVCRRLLDVRNQTIRAYIAVKRRFSRKS
ncbi:MAG: glycosyltransferase [Clostridiales bacterium]|nr:glycosyltransferase [Clostridiales bacterium]